MKKLTLLLFAVCACWFTSAGQAISGRNILEGEALAEAKRDFVGLDYDYYAIQHDNTIKHWTIMVDAEPNSPWNHRCYIYNVPKFKDVEGKNKTQKVILPFAPMGDYKDLDVKNRMDDKATMKPHISKKTYFTQEEADIAARTYAVIIAGAPSQMHYTERYWNDCSLIYQTLVHRYGVPKANIYPLMSDGSNPAADMRAIDGTIKSQSLDLDFDGNNEIQFAATNANIKYTLSSLVSKLNEDDQLFIYLTGYAEQDPDFSYMIFGEEDYLSDSELAEALAPFAAKYVNINVLVAQNTGIGFVDKLGAVNGCVVCSATGLDQRLLYCDDVPYTRFTYDWASAMIGNTPTGATVSADTDKNGRVTVQEAFRYAATNCAASKPAYKSLPESVGEDLAFNYLAPAVDLYIKDNVADTGKEPNTTTDMYWDSPSIWIRNENDNVQEQENPVYVEGHGGVYVGVKVHNRGKKSFVYEVSNKKKLYIQGYWSKSGTCFTPEAWLGLETDENGDQNGFPMKSVQIKKNINSGDSAVFMVEWQLPSPDDFEGPNKHLFCLFFKIRDKAMDTEYFQGKSTFTPLSCNKHAQKNRIIKSAEEVDNGYKVHIGNTDELARRVSIEMYAEKFKDRKLFYLADVDLKLSPRIYEAWKEGGFKSQNIRRPQSADQIRFVGSGSRLEDIQLGAREFDTVTLSVKFNDRPTDEEYICDLIQRDEDGKIVGGETFVIKAPQAAANALNISEAPADNGRRELVADMEGFATVRWKNSRGEDVGEEAALNVLATPGNNTFKAIAMTADGKIAVSDYTIETVQGIEAVSAVGDNVTVQLSDAAPAGASITIGAASGIGEKISAEVPAGAKELSISAPGLVNGVNAVTLSVNDEKIDSKKFVK